MFNEYKMKLFKFIMDSQLDNSAVIKYLSKLRDAETNKYLYSIADELLYESSISHKESQQLIDMKRELSL